MKNKFTYEEYMNSSKKLFKALFGQKLFDKLSSCPLKSIEWDGIEIECDQLRAVCLSIKERFSKEGIEYYSEMDGSLLDLYLGVVFHYGFQQRDEQEDKASALVLKILKELEKEENTIKPPTE